MTESTTSSDCFEVDRPVIVASSRDTPSDLQHQTADAPLDASSNSVKTPTYTGSYHDAGEEVDDSQEPIEFEETSVISLNSSRFTEVSHTLRILPECKVTNVLGTYSSTRVNVTVRQTMTSQGLDLKGKSYKVLFAGDRSFREPIVQKIGTALAATFRSSTPDSEDSQPRKFNVVPISAFGDSGNPDVVLIDSSGLELNVEDCNNAAFQTSENGKDALRLSMTDGRYVTSSWTGEKYVLSKDWTRPDLAVFCMSDDERDSSKQIRRITRSFMNRHGVPSLAISKQALYEKHIDATTLATLDYLTPHICLESQGPNEHKPYVKRRLPIDLDTFLNIDAGQMNRNLACLATSKRMNEPRARIQELEQEVEDGFGACGAFVGQLKSSFPFLFTPEASKAFKMLAILCGGLCMALLPAIIMMAFRQESTGQPFLADRIEQAVRADISRSLALSSAPIQSLSTSTPQISHSSVPTIVASSPKSMPSPISSAKSLSTNRNIASSLMDAYVVGPNTSEKFSVHALGDCHIVLRPPHWFTKLRKAPTLLFKVSRGDATLGYIPSMLFEGVYALQIPREEAYGLLNVSISTLAKPVLEETFEVDFGSSWLKIAAWKRATRAVTDAMQNDFSLVQTGWNIVYSQTKSELSTFVQKTKTKVAGQRKADHKMLASHLNWTVQTKDLVLAQTKDLSRNLSLKFHQRQKDAAKQIQSLTKDVTRSISIYVHDTKHAIALQAHVFAHTVTRFKISGSLYTLHPSRSMYLRAAQKKTLKAWYSLVGAPKRYPVVHKNMEPQRGRKAGSFDCDF